MATGRKRITSSSSYSTEKRKQILEAKKSEFKHPEYDSHNCFTAFIIAQKEKGNSKETISFYNRFYKKYCAYCEALYEKEVENFDMKMLLIEHLVAEMNQMFFMNYLEKQGLNNQTINTYLRGLRSWGNWCEEEGYIEGFKSGIRCCLENHPLSMVRKVCICNCVRQFLKS